MALALFGGLLAANCTLLSTPTPPPAQTPTETPSPTPTATPTPEASPGAEANDAAAEAANEAEQKARQAARKAAEAAAVAAEASAAAREAAKAAAKAVAASKMRGGGTRRAAKETPRASASPTPTPEVSPTVEPSALGTTSALVTPPEEFQKQIDELDSQMKNIDRGRLSDADSQRYDIATGLVASARKALSKGDYMAANSLSQKAKVVVQSIGH